MKVLKVLKLIAHFDLMFSPLGILPYLRRLTKMQVKMPSQTDVAVQTISGWMDGWMDWFSLLMMLVVKSHFLHQKLHSAM